MGLLLELFPGLGGKKTEGIPSWSGISTPWGILSNDSYGLMAQIEEIAGKEGGVFIHPSASIGDFVKIEGPCFIGPKAEIRHSAYLRKGSWICEGAIVGHSSEVKNSILLPGAKAPHFNYVGDSIVGIDVNLGAGAILSNVRNDGRNIFVTLEDGSRFDSGFRKMGALIGDGSQLGCNVVTNPGSILTPDSMIPPNESVKGWV